MIKFSGRFSKYGQNYYSGSTHLIEVDFYIIPLQQRILTTSNSFCCSNFLLFIFHSFLAAPCIMCMSSEINSLPLICSI